MTKIAVLTYSQKHRKTFDTFHSVAQRIYENEIDMLIGAVEHIHDKHEFLVPQNEVFKRMPLEIEKVLYERLEKRKRKVCKEDTLERYSWKSCDVGDEYS